MPVYAEKPLIYKSVAGDGSVEFTDQPAPNAVIINPSPINVVDAPTSQTDQSPTPATGQAPVGADADQLPDSQSASITSVTISSPAHQATIIDKQEPIWVVIETAPAAIIPTGLTAEVMLDGKRVVTGSSARLPLEVPERGMHLLQVRIVDSEGLVVAESTKYEIHVKQ